MYLEKHGRKIFYRMDGNENGKRLVLLNSLGTSTASWGSVVEELATDFQILRIDKAGHGLSDPMTGPRTIADNVDDVHDVILHLNWYGADVCGISIGAMTIIELAARLPDIFDKLILSNTSAYVRPEPLLRRVEIIRQGGICAASENAVKRFFSPDYHKGETLDYLRALDDFNACDAESYIGWCQAIATMDLRPLVKRISNTCLTIIGTYDEATLPSMGHSIYKNLQNATLIELNAGHLPYLEKPKLYAKTLRDFIYEQ
ncbi:alpha/beta fold hydrolase [Brucella thiophenivorans]|uniref:Alpha/beta hydrolase family protein n=1 Tax=Brucella thiophenivorans TaxID=571255 RepID=A0A256FS40_9HYPH|nr:alpha/beta fold hydrolase [Brucella thiophenivorans]OYR17568.1 alpha/beta hydrolase family protein [Brucella thiophenivorans]